MILKNIEVGNYVDTMYTGKHSHNSERIFYIYLSKKPLNAFIKV